MTLPNYEIYAIKYATRDAKRAAHFVGGDPHDAPMPMDYFVWLVRNAERTIVIDTGFTRSMAEQRKRVFIRSPADGLAWTKVPGPNIEQKDFPLQGGSWDSALRYADGTLQYFLEIGNQTTSIYRATLAWP